MALEDGEEPFRSDDERGADGDPEKPCAEKETDDQLIAVENSEIFPKDDRLGKERISPDEEKEDIQDIGRDLTSLELHESGYTLSLRWLNHHQVRPILYARFACDERTISPRKIMGIA